MTITPMAESEIDRVGEGIGRRLYDAAEAAIRAGGHRRVTLHAFRGAVPFYRHMGLAVVGWNDPAGPLAGLRAAVMRKELDPGDT